MPATPSLPYSISSVLFCSGRPVCIRLTDCETHTSVASQREEQNQNLLRGITFLFKKEALRKYSLCLLQTCMAGQPEQQRSWESDSLALQPSQCRSHGEVCQACVSPSISAGHSHTTYMTTVHMGQINPQVSGPAKT